MHLMNGLEFNSTDIHDGDREVTDQELRDLPATVDWREKVCKCISKYAQEVPLYSFSYDVQCIARLKFATYNTFYFDKKKVILVIISRGM